MGSIRVLLEPHLAKADAGKVQQVRDQVRLQARIAIDGLDTLERYRLEGPVCA